MESSPGCDISILYVHYKLLLIKYLYDFTSPALISMDLDVYGAEIWELFQAFEEFWVIRSSGV